MPSVLAPKPKRGTHLDYEALRSACADAVDASGLTQARVGAAVAEATPDRNRAPSPAAVSNAVRESGSKVAALQLDILRTLTGATFTGPLYRVD